MLQSRQISHSIIDAANRLQFPGFALNMSVSDDHKNVAAKDLAMMEIDLVDMYQYYKSYENFKIKTDKTIDVSPAEWQKLDFLNRQQSVHGLRGDWQLRDEEVIMYVELLIFAYDILLIQQTWYFHQLARCS